MEFILASALYTLLDTNQKGSGKVSVYGEDWCGYTTKQRKNLKKNKIPYKYIDCAKPKNKKKCKKFASNGYPVTVMPQQVIDGFHKFE